LRNGDSSTDATPRRAGTETDEKDLVLALHERLATRYQLDRWHWSDATPAFDICVGAILVQHTAWANVEKALANLRARGIESLPALYALEEDELALLVRPAGTPLTKARRLRAFAGRIAEAGGMEEVMSQSAPALRAFLLSTTGIGPETADVIGLYAARQPVIVHDAYTRRFFRRIGLGPEREDYESWRAWLDQLLPPDGDLRRVHHAGIVVHCKETCRARPRCAACPVEDLCAHAKM
jgi:endonuclease III related protein